MLSEEIYGLWESTTEEDVRQHVHSYQVPSELEEAHSFKAAVLEQIGKRRAESKRFRESRIERMDEFQTKCCCCIRKGKERSDDSKVHECNSISSFETLGTVSKTMFTSGIVTLKALIRKLSYWEHMKQGMDGLSVVGSYMWMLSYACQHLIDGPGAKESFQMLSNLSNIKEKYQELGQAGEMFIELAEKFHEDIYFMRQYGLLTLKRLIKRWSVATEYNPLIVRPEPIKKMPRPRKRVGQGLDSPIDVDDDEDVFSLRWSPLTIYLQISSNSKMFKFSKLHPQDRIIVFQKYLQLVLDLVEVVAEELSVLSSHLSKVEISEGKFLTGKDLTLSILRFAKSVWAPKTLSEKQRRTMLVLLNEYWYSLDVFHESAFIFVRLVQETRDIIRTCYVYTDVFYQWSMPAYDTFIPRGRRSVKESYSGQVRDCQAKLIPASRKLSETTNIMMLMDFTNSIYQAVLLDIPIPCDDMTLYLKNAEQENEDDQTYGLVNGMIDRRKTDKFLVKH